MVQGLEPQLLVEPSRRRPIAASQGRPRSKHFRFHASHSLKALSAQGRLRRGASQPAKCVSRVRRDLCCLQTTRHPAEILVLWLRVNPALNTWFSTKMQFANTPKACSLQTCTPQYPTTTMKEEHLQTRPCEYMVLSASCRWTIPRPASCSVGWSPTFRPKTNGLFIHAYMHTHKCKLFPPMYQYTYIYIYLFFFK